MLRQHFGNNWFETKVYRSCFILRLNVNAWALWNCLMCISGPVFLDDLEYSTEPVSLPETDGTFDSVRWINQTTVCHESKKVWESFFYNVPLSRHPLTFAVLLVDLARNMTPSLILCYSCDVKHSGTHPEAPIVALILHINLHLKSELEWVAFISDQRKCLCWT